jgi:dTDP-D-glucose 4,6-dehydratase
MELLGLRDVLLVAGQGHAGDFIDLLGDGRVRERHGDGSLFDLDLTYKVQTEPGGIAQVVGMAESFAAGESLVVCSHFVKRLVAGGDEVVVLDKLTYSGREENVDGIDCELRVGDIADPEAVAGAAAGCEAIVNFAAETHVDRSILGATDFGRTEFFGTQVLLEEVRRTRARYVQVSTYEVYGDLGGGGSANESHPVGPSSPYSVAKAAGDLHVPAYVPIARVTIAATRSTP